MARKVRFEAGSGATKEQARARLEAHYLYAAGKMPNRIPVNALVASAEALSLLSHETRALLQRDLYRAVRAYAESAIKPRAGDAPAGEPVSLADTAAGDPKIDKKVELF